MDYHGICGHYLGGDPGDSLAQVRTISLNSLRLLGLWKTPESVCMNRVVCLKEAELEGMIQVWISDLSLSMFINL